MLSGLLVWSAGFGALLAFSATTPRAAGLPGLFDYASATWGDGLALPTMTGALVYGISHLSRARWERPAGGAAAFLGVGLGAATQVQWLRDDAPHLNWTLPRPHHFNAAGVYHGVFLTVMSGLTAALWALLLLRIAGSHGARTDRHAALLAGTIALVGAAAFVALLAIDSLPARSTRASTATVTATGVGATLLLGLFAWTAVRIRRRDRD